ncbi:MAG TPA: glucokinase [Candidatus Saccharimonadales bacterium]|nr:glucokinase [Candidatus Saccharimonadales bacterium]
MAELAVPTQAAFVEGGGTGWRGYVTDMFPDELPKEPDFHISTEGWEQWDEDFLQNVINHHLTSIVAERRIRIGGVALAVDGPEARKLGVGIFRSHKTRQIIDPKITSDILGGSEVEAMGDIMAMAWGLPTVKANELTTVSNATGYEIEDNFTDTRTLVLGVGSGVGGTLYNPQSGGDVQITSLHSGHKGWQARSADELRYQALRHYANRSRGINTLTTVEHALSGQTLLEVADCLEPDYAKQLFEGFGKDFDAIGRAVANDVSSINVHRRKAAAHIKRFQAEVLGTVIFDDGAANEAEAVVLTGGGIKGLHRWIVGGTTLFKERVEDTSNESIAYTPPHVVIGPSNLSIRGGIHRASQLAQS